MTHATLAILARSLVEHHRPGAGNGLEAAAHVEAEVVGKPSAGFFTAALARLHVDAAAAVMIGDDVNADVLAAQRNGITGVLVKTGKYLPQAVEAADGVPDYVLDSIADLPALLTYGDHARP